MIPKKVLAEKFLMSALHTLKDTNVILSWIEDIKKNVNVQIELTSFSKLKNWKFASNQMQLQHISGGFFSIQGLDVKTNWGDIKNWKQPIINQPEVGILGVISKEIDGVLHFLLQAKIEPGNINEVQLSPTLQATKSNFTQVHGGSKPHYLEYFTSEAKCVLIDQLQSEQGSRFLKKRNRNIIILVESEIPILDNFIWLTLAEIHKLIELPNVINMDTRTVFSSVFYSDIDNEKLEKTYFPKLSSLGHAILLSSCKIETGPFSFEELLSWLTELKTKYELSLSQVSLNEMTDWIIEDNEIRRFDERFFKVIPINIQINNREVATWDQPMILPMNDGICGFLIKIESDIMYFLVQAKLECGNHDIIELAPTVQCLTGSYLNDTPPRFLNYFINARKKDVIYDVYQSEEGGRFFQEQNRNMIVQVDENFTCDDPHYRWMTIGQLKKFLLFNNYLNIQSRSLISAISFSWKN